MQDIVNNLALLLIALIGSAGFWAMMQTREAQRNQYSETLKEQVNSLSDKLDAHLLDKEVLYHEIASLRSELSAAQVTIKHLEEMLRQR